MSAKVFREFASIIGGSTPANLYGVDLHGTQNTVYGSGGNIFFNGLPERDRDTVGIFLASQPVRYYPQTNWTEYRFQVWVRSGAQADEDKLGGLDLATEIDEHIHGWSAPVGYLGDINYILADMGPQSVGYTDNDKAEWMTTYTVRVSTDANE